MCICICTRIIRFVLDNTSIFLGGIIHACAFRFQIAYTIDRLLIHGPSMTRPRLVRFLRPPYSASNLTSTSYPGYSSFDPPLLINFWKPDVWFVLLKPHSLLKLPPPPLGLRVIITYEPFHGLPTASARQIGPKK